MRTKYLPVNALCSFDLIMQENIIIRTYHISLLITVYRFNLILNLKHTLTLSVSDRKKGGARDVVAPEKTCR